MENNSNDKIHIWSDSTKIIVGFAVLILFSFLFFRFVNFISPLMITAVLVYILHPLARKVTDKTKLKWTGSVNLVFFIIVIISLGVITIFGVTIITQIQNIIDIVSTFIADFPEFFDETINQVIEINIFNRFYWELNISETLGNLNIDPFGITEQILGFIQPLLGQAGSLVGSIAGQAANFFVWLFFIFMTSFFILSSLGPTPEFFSGIKDREDLYNDLMKLLDKLNIVWDTYIRGQIVIVVLVMFFNFILMSTLGINGALGIAILAGAARFVPYVGAFISGTTVGVVALIQGNPYFEMNSFVYAIIVLGFSILLDTVFDNVVTPKLLGNSLGVHPASVLLASIVLLQLIGFLGLLLAAPILASILVFGRYIARKLLNLDPWVENDLKPRKPVSLNNIANDIIKAGKETYLNFKSFILKMIEKIKIKLKRKNEDG